MNTEEDEFCKRIILLCDFIHCVVCIHQVARQYHAVSCIVLLMSAVIADNCLNYMLFADVIDTMSLSSA